jgi:hypothetical protein
MKSGSSTSTVAFSPPQFAADFDNNKCEVLQQQADQGDFTGLRQFLAKTRQNNDWQDRYFVLDVVAPSVQPDSLDAICAAEPNASDLSLIRGAHLFNLVGKSRGTKTANQTTEQQFAQAGQYIKATIATLRHSMQLDPVDPTPHVFAMRSFQVFSDLRNHLQQAYQQAIHLASDFVPAHFVMVNAQSEKWGGSHAQALQVARSAMSHAGSGSDAAACIFLAHILVWQHATLFEKDRKRAEAYLNDPKVAQELNEAFERWTRPPYQARRSSLPYLHHAAYWYYQVGDRPRLQQALARTAGKHWDKAWVFAGDGHRTYSSALEYATTGSKNGSAQPGKKNGLFGWFR